MGAQIVRMDFTPGENEQIDTVIKVPEEPRSVIHGIVKDYCDNIIVDAVVKLFVLENPNNPCSLKPITHTFTDECGEFLFGPLTPCKHYVVKVWVSDTKIRHLELRPDDDDKCGCEGKEHEEHKGDTIKTYQDVEIKKANTSPRPQGTPQKRAGVTQRPRKQP